MDKSLLPLYCNGMAEIQITYIYLIFKQGVLYFIKKRDTDKI